MQEILDIQPASAQEAEAEAFALTSGDAPQVPVTRGQILRLQASMVPHACAMFPHVDHFAPGMYVRELTIPAGSLVVGKTHRHAHPMIVLRGRALVISEFGRQEVEGGHFSISQPGAKRVVLAFEDTTFLTVHANADDCQDAGELESRIIRPEDPAELEAAIRGLLR